MIDPTKWKLHPLPIYTVPSDAIEDLSVVPEGDQFRAYFTTGPNLQDQRLYTALAPSPLGPFGPATRVPDNPAAHTRLYRTRLIDGPAKGDAIITAVWPGLPKVGLWRFEELPGTGLMRKTLLVPPAPESKFCSVAVANPCAYWDGQHYNIYFEGRNEAVFWWLMQAVWDGVSASATIVEQPICDGANPHCILVGDTYYLYYSKYAGRGFETWVLTQRRA